MRAILQTLYWVLIITAVVGCNTGRKALEKGDYDKAVGLAVNRLRSNENSEKAKSTLRKAYKLALDLHMDNVRRSKNATDPMRWEYITSNYQQINSLYDQIIRCPACREVVPRPLQVDNELADARQKAAANRYELGLAALNYSRDRNKAIEAHQHFQRTKEFVPRYKDVEMKLLEALDAATLRVVVEPIPVPMKALNLRHEFFVNKINEYLHNQRISEYVRFFTPDEARSQNLSYVDHVIKMEFERFALGNLSSRTIEREVSRDSVMIAERNGEKFYGTVRATLIINERAITGEGLLDFRILDNDLKKVITQEKMPSAYTWVTSWASYNGDKRALSDEELDLVNRKEVNIPNPQWMFEEFTAPLYDQVIRKITSYYRNY